MSFSLLNNMTTDTFLFYAFRCVDQYGLAAGNFYTPRHGAALASRMPSHIGGHDSCN